MPKCSFVDVIAQNAAENPYIRRFLEEAMGSDLQELHSKIAEEGNVIFPDVVAYAMVQERVTRAMRDDWTVLEACHAVWSEATSIDDLSKHFNLFESVKTMSINYPIELFLDFHRKGEVPKSFATALLPMNILEAAISDFQQGKEENAKAGLSLAINILGNGLEGEAGPGAAGFTEDGQGIALNAPLAREWADLYQTWNLAFGSQYEHFPYVMAKLLIPSVSDYQEAPEEYLYNRVLALYFGINFEILGRVNGGVNQNSMNWASDDLTEIWGQVNDTSSQSYESDLMVSQEDLLARGLRTVDATVEEISNLVEDAMGTLSEAVALPH